MGIDGDTVNFCCNLYTYNCLRTYNSSADIVEIYLQGAFNKLIFLINV